MTESRREYAQQEAQELYEALYGPLDFELDDEGIDEGLRCLTHPGGRFAGHYADSVCGCLGEIEGEPEPVCSEVIEGFASAADPCRFETTRMQV